MTEIRLVGPTGPGGVGRSRIALRAAGDRAARYPDGICPAELILQERPDTQILATIAERTAGSHVERNVTRQGRPRRGRIASCLTPAPATAAPAAAADCDRRPVVEQGGPAGQPQATKRTPLGRG